MVGEYDIEYNGYIEYNKKPDPVELELPVDNDWGFFVELDNDFDYNYIYLYKNVNNKVFTKQKDNVIKIQKNNNDVTCSELVNIFYNRNKSSLNDNIFYKKYGVITAICSVVVFVTNILINRNRKWC